VSNVKIFAKTIEDEAITQIEALANEISFQDQKIRIMPDVHVGRACVIGFTSTMGDFVIPNVVGVDIGCGMLTIELGQIDIDSQKLDGVIRKYVPSGRNTHDGKIKRFSKIKELCCYRELENTKRLERSVGTLGGGNHFIEVGVDDNGNKYLVIHTGSRNLGKQVAEHHQNLAYALLCGKDKLLTAQEALITEYKAAGRRSELSEAIKELRRNHKTHKTNVPKELAYLTGQYKDNYLHDMAICQEYAIINRATIGEIIVEQMALTPMGSFETIHNYIDIEDGIIRKGAISAKQGERLLIPLNMRDGCIIGVGKGNPDWNCSAPHGAGRTMSRMKAKERFTLDEYQRSMEGIYSTSINADTLDEMPMAYKNMADIIDVIGNTVEIECVIKPVYNFKASE
jgi:RNA-splicing ligase RtcB